MRCPSRSRVTAATSSAVRLTAAGDAGVLLGSEAEATDMHYFSKYRLQDYGERRTDPAVPSSTKACDWKERSRGPYGLSGATAHGGLARWKSNGVGHSP